MRRVLGDLPVGRVAIEFEVANYGDLEEVRRKHLKPNQVRRLTIRGIVDTGAVGLVLPGAVVKQLGLPPGQKRRVRYADGRRALRDTVQGVQVEILGRKDTFTALVEPNRDDALVGVIVLEALDLLVDPIHECLVPRDPRYPIFEAE